MAVHGLEHFKAGLIESNERKIIVEGGKPPLVFVMLVGDEVWDVPGKECERLSGEAAWFVKYDGWFHVGKKRMSAAAYTRGCDYRKASRV